MQLLETVGLLGALEDILWTHMVEEVAKEVEQWQVRSADLTKPRQSLAGYSTLGKLLLEAVDGLSREEVIFLEQI